jgi:hypothetical protein
MSTADAPRCTATRKDGSACSLPALPSGDVCFAHGATRSTKAKGGKNSAGVVRMQKHLSPELVAAQTLLIQLLNDVRKGTVTPRVGEVLGGLTGRLLDLAKFRMEAGETAALAERLAALEAQLDLRRRA